jgi:elongation factor 1 alpha-like protein
MPKMSKLQALAAARKKKAQEQKETTSTKAEGNPVDEPPISATLQDSDKGNTSKFISSADKNSSRTYPTRKRKSPSPHRQTPKPLDPVAHTSIQPTEGNLSVTFIEQAKPSAFASTMFGNSDPAPNSSLTKTSFTLPYPENHAAQSTNAFTGPSPDDIVIAAQSKGSVHSAKVSKK